MTKNIDQRSEPSGNQGSPDPGARTRSEVDKEIAGLRNELDEHLRDLDVSITEERNTQTIPSQTKSQHAGNGNESPANVNVAKRIGIVFLATTSGLFLGVAISIYLVAYERARAPRQVVQDSQRIAVSPSPSPKLSEVRPTPPQVSTPPVAPRRDTTSADETNQTSPPAPPPTDSTTTARWQACVEQDEREAAPPQPGDTWWPVVGPGDSLADARRHCRADAYINQNGNAQISSFRDRETAVAFAEQLSNDSSHPWRFWIGDPTLR
jgi:hypothetical protein